MAHETPFSFHCMICFEEFDPEVRYPVVLPCGHTYVCNPCAERLDKCMECRTLLYQLVPRTAPNKKQPSTDAHRINHQHHPSSASVRSSWSSSRSSAHPRSSPVPGEKALPPIKKRFPLPKNVVLLSLIEATELACEDIRTKYSGSPRSDTGIPDGAIVDSSIDAMVPSMSSVVFDDDEDKIKAGTSNLAGVAGTYAVASREGLEIFPSRPASMDMDVSNALTDEDVDTLVRFFHLDHKVEPEQRETNSPGNNGHKDPARLSFGDRVQIVSVDGGWAKLARGYGYIRADKNQLVKVGGSIDKACKLEAMLRTLSNKRKELRIKQSKVDNKFIRLMNDLQLSLQNDEDLTVICGDTFSSAATEKLRIEQPPEPKEDRAVMVVEERNDVNGPKKPPKIERESTPPASRSGGGFVCFANDVFDSDDDMPRRRYLEVNRQPFLMNAPQNSQASLPDQTTSAELFPAVASHPSPSEMRAGARAWRERHGRSPRTGIDFRTGMSGHMALLSTHAHPHELLEQPVPATSSQHVRPVTRSNGSSSATSFKMSAHTALSVSRPLPAPLSGVLNALRLPMLGFPQHRDDHQGSGVKHSGSM